MTTSPDADAVPVPEPAPAFDAASPVPETYDVFCEGCGYSLIHLAADRCPECGLPYDPLALPYARVPWLHRRRLGRWTAYWQTVRQVVLSPAAFAAELSRPVRISAKDARSFRRVSIHIAAISATVLAALAVSKLGGFQPSGVGETARTLLRIGLLLLCWASGVTFLRLATDVPVFIWKGLPSLPASELAPLHHYAAAPLALFPLAAVVALVPVSMAGTSSDPLGSGLPFVVGAAAVVVGWMILCWETPLLLMRAATGCGRGRVMLLAVYLPFHYLVMALLTFCLTTIVTIVLVGVGEILEHVL